MFNSLYAKLVALMLVVLALVGLVQIALMSHAAQLYFQEVTQDVNRDVAQQIAQRREILASGSFDKSKLKRLFSELMTTHPSIEVYALDASGHIVSFSAPPQAVIRSSVALAPIQKFLAGARLPVLGDDPRDTSGRKVFSVAPVRQPSAANSALVGYIYVVLEGQSFQSVTQRLRGSFILRQSVLVAAASLTLALLTALYLLKGLTRRLGRLASNMRSFEESGFSEPPVVSAAMSRTDEIQQLETSFAAMAACIVQQVKQIRGVDIQRRELLANLSHDLRTPLASLQGYLDTVLLKEGLSVSEQREFLRIAARHGERLGKLIEDLFELAKLDSPQIPLNCEQVAIAELVQDSIQKIHAAAASKSVSLEAKLEQNLPCVCVDVALISRAIDNLLDNALRYTRSGGTVSASVRQIEGKIEVCVADNGCGIAPADLPRIFDRFYQAGSASTDAAAAISGGGVGLGLAITKQILALHDASLTVISDRAVGTQFSFKLKPAALTAARIKSIQEDPTGTPGKHNES